MIKNAGFASDEITNEIAAVILSLPLSFVRLLGTVIAITMIDARGRRKILLQSLPILTLCMVLLTGAIAAYALTE